MRRSCWWVSIAVLLLSFGPAGRDSATGEPEPAGDCEILGVVTRGQAPVAAEIVLTRYADVAAVRLARARMPTLPAPGGDPAHRVVRVKADASGRFAGTGLAPGCYAVLARGAGGLTAESVVILHADGMRRTVDLSLAAGQLVEGRLTWSHGAAVQGTVVLWRHHGRGGYAGSGPYNPWREADEVPPPGPRRRAVLDAQGAFRFARLPPARWTIRVETKAGAVLHGWTSHAREDTRYEETVARPMLRVQGRVVDRVSGRPVAAAHVEAMPPGRGARLRVATATTTGANGRFDFAVADPAAALTVSAPGHGTRVIKLDAGTPMEVALPPTRILRGRVRRPDGSPAPGARVVVAGEEYAAALPAFQEARADDEGRFEVPGVPRAARVVFVRGGGWSSVGLADVSARGHNPFLQDPAAAGPLDLLVEPAATIRGRLLDHEGRPVRGATLRALGTNRHRGVLFPNREAERACVGPAVVTTAADGGFVIADCVPDLLYEVYVTAPGLPATRVGPLPGRVSTKPITVRVSAPRPLEVLVRDKDTKKPIAGVTVTLYAEDGRPRWMPQPPTTTTDAQGRAHFEPVKDGRLGLWVHRKDYLPSPGNLEVARTDGHGPLAHVVDLVRGLRIEGVVQDMDGNALGEAWVRARPRTRDVHTHGRVTTGKDGTFVLEGLAPGSYEVRAARSHADAPGEPSTVEAGARGLVLRLSAAEATAPRRLTVRVLDPSGAPVPRVHVSAASAKASAGMVARDGEGTLSLDRRRFADGAVYLVVDDARDAEGELLPLGRRVVGPVASDAAEVTVRLAAESVMQGRVVGAEGEPLHGARVSARAASPVAREGRPPRDVHVGAATTDAEGRFRIGRLGPGRHVLHVDAGHEYLAPAPKEVQAGAEPVTLVLAPARTARLRILGPDDAPLGSATVRVDAVRPVADLPARGGGRSARGRSAADGSVVLRRLAPGVVYRLEVVPAGADAHLQVLRIDRWEPADATLRIPRGMSIAGTVRYASGGLANDARIQIRGEHLSGGVRVRDGAFRRDRLVPGRYRIIARGRGGTRDWDDPELPSVTVETDATDIVLVLPDP